MSDVAPKQVPPAVLTPSPDMEGLIELMRTLRDPMVGCAWDRAQTFETIAPYTIEEAYEVAEAVSRRDLGGLRDELGDLLFQVVFHARLAEEGGAFGFEDVVAGLVTKMVRRHPHVWSAGEPAPQKAGAWEDIKAAERAERHDSLLDDIPAALPALARAEKLQRRAARSGFDWTSTPPIVDKIEEELGEVRAAIASGSHGEIEEEIGDLLFACVNLARRCGLEAETVLRRANAKFERRYRGVEAGLRAQGHDPLGGPHDLERLEALWTSVKAAERAAQAACDPLPSTTATS
jgi:MazG family protein